VENVKAAVRKYDFFAFPSSFGNEDL